MAAKAAKKSDEENTGNFEQRPVLSSATTRALRSIADAFRNAPPIEAPPTPETLSAL